MARHSNPGKRQAGYTYIWALAAVAVAGIYLARYAEVASFQAQREREAELLRIGSAYTEALRGYYRDAASPAERYPQRLEDLVSDPRVPFPRRHLRKIYADPLIQSTDWGLVRNAEQRIVGVYSQAKGVPIRQEGLGDEFPGFAGQTSYRYWIFQYQPDIGLSGGRRG